MKTIEVAGERLEVELAASAFERMKGLRFRTSGRMLFPLEGARPVIDGFFVRGKLNLYFIADGELVERAELPPWSFYRPSNRSDYLLESFESLELEEGDGVKVP